MSFKVTNNTVSQLLGYIHTNQIAIPEIQRPFVWNASKVRDLIDSLYRGYPIGYIILWNNPNIKAKDGTITSGKKIIIDGQQRITALTSAILGYEIVDNNYKKKRIKIAFNPLENDGIFEVQSNAHIKDTRWIEDISLIFDNNFSSFKFVNNYCQMNADIEPDNLNKIIDKLKYINNIQLGTIELDERIDIETVTDIFIRINSQGKKLSQADFVMSKIASDDKYGGNNLRKVIDYFCHLAVVPADYEEISRNDIDFAKTDFANKIAWLKDDREDIYDPDFNDLLRVAFMYKFDRANLSILVSLLSGRNFETREFEEVIAEKSFKKLEDGVVKFINQHNFTQFALTLRSIGFISPKMISSGGVLSFAYQLFLRLSDSELSKPQVKKYVQKWFLLSYLTQRYSGSAETAMDKDLRSIRNKSFPTFFEEIESAELSDTFWDIGLVQMLETTSINNPAFNTYLASQVFFKDTSFLSNTSKVSDLIETRGDVHHIFPRAYLKKNGYSNRNQYNQVANYTYLDTQVNITIGSKAPIEYLNEAINQCETKELVIGSINDKKMLDSNLLENSIPLETYQYDSENYLKFLESRRKLMAQKLKRYYYSI